MGYTQKLENTGHKTSNAVIGSKNSLSNGKYKNGSKHKSKSKIYGNSSQQNLQMDALDASKSEAINMEALNASRQNEALLANGTSPGLAMGQQQVSGQQVTDGKSTSLHISNTSNKEGHLINGASYVQSSGFIPPNASRTVSGQNILNHQVLQQHLPSSQHILVTPTPIVIAPSDPNIYNTWNSSAGHTLQDNIKTIPGPPQQIILTPQLSPNMHYTTQSGYNTLSTPIVDYGPRYSKYNTLDTTHSGLASSNYNTLSTHKLGGTNQSAYSTMHSNQYSTTDSNRNRANVSSPTPSFNTMTNVPNHSVRSNAASLQESSVKNQRSTVASPIVDPSLSNNKSSQNHESTHIIYVQPNSNPSSIGQSRMADSQTQISSATNMRSNNYDADSSISTNPQAVNRQRNFSESSIISSDQPYVQTVHRQIVTEKYENTIVPPSPPNKVPTVFQTVTHSQPTFKSEIKHYSGGLNSEVKQTNSSEVSNSKQPFLTSLDSGSQSLSKNGGLFLSSDRAYSSEHNKSNFASQSHSYSANNAESTGRALKSNTGSNPSHSDYGASSFSYGASHSTGGIKQNEDNYTGSISNQGNYNNSQSHYSNRTSSEFTHKNVPTYGSMYMNDGHKRSLSAERRLLLGPSSVNLEGRDYSWKRPSSAMDGKRHENRSEYLKHSGSDNHLDRDDYAHLRYSDSNNEYTRSQSARHHGGRWYETESKLPSFSQAMSLLDKAQTGELIMESHHKKSYTNNDDSYSKDFTYREISNYVDSSNKSEL